MNYGIWGIIIGVFLLILSIIGIRVTDNYSDSPDAGKMTDPVEVIVADGEQVSEELQGYWESDNYMYLEFTGDELILRDYSKQIILQSPYTCEREEDRIRILPESTDLVYWQWFDTPFAHITDFYLENGTVSLTWLTEGETKDEETAVFESAEEGPFADILIRDEEFLEELQGTWKEDTDGIGYTVQIDGNHMTIGFEQEDGTLSSSFETDFHVISYVYNDSLIYLIQADLVNTEFYGFSQFQYRDGALYTQIMVADADWDTGVIFKKADD